MKGRVDLVKHLYISTACLHDLHEKCGVLQHDRGEEGVPHCKWCDAICLCPVCKHDEVKQD